MGITEFHIDVIFLERIKLTKEEVGREREGRGEGEGEYRGRGRGRCDTGIITSLNLIQGDI